MAVESVKLESEMWGQVLTILTTAPVPWTLSNPLIQAIAPQLQAQRQVPQGVQPNGYIDAQRSAPGTGEAPAILPTSIARGGPRSDGT